MKTKASILLLCDILLFITTNQSIANQSRHLSFRLDPGLAGIIWTPEDKKDIDGQKLYHQHHPFLFEFVYGRTIKGEFGLCHFFSQEKEHTEIDSLGNEFHFTPKLRQYAIHFGVQANQNLIPRMQIYCGMGTGIFWRSYNPGWKDRSYWDKVRVTFFGQGGLDVNLGLKTWIGAGWRYYTVGWKEESRWKRGEFNRLRRMSILSLNVRYVP